MKASVFPTGPVRWVTATRVNVTVDHYQTRRTLMTFPVPVLVRKLRKPIPEGLLDFM